jgi:hypothetical protein
MLCGRHLAIERHPESERYRDQAAKHSDCRHLFHEQRDFDSDGKSDSGVFRNGTWYIRKSFESTPASTALQVILWGTAGDVPISTIYVKAPPPPALPQR